MNSILETVCSVCNSTRNKSKHGVQFHELLVILRKEFRKQEIFLKIRGLRTRKLSNEEFYVNAYYDSFDDEHNEVPIEVFVHHNFKIGTVWDRQHVTDFLIQIFDAVVHEFKHRRQSRKRDFRQYWGHTDGKEHYKEYLSDPDEVDAYALSIAIELCRSLGKYRALKYLHKISSLSKLKFQNQFASVNLSAYSGQFGNISNPIMKRLVKKVYIRLQKLDADAIFS